MGTSRGASISYFGTTLSCVLTYQSNSSIKFEIWSNSNSSLTSTSSKTIGDRARPFEPMKTTFQAEQVG